ncbi:hypothetical protein D3C75_548570 [compost metagenome]
MQLANDLIRRPVINTEALAYRFTLYRCIKRLNVVWVTPGRKHRIPLFVLHLFL